MCSELSELRLEREGKREREKERKSLKFTIETSSVCMCLSRTMQCA